MARTTVVKSATSTNTSVDTQHPLYAKYKDSWRRVKACVAGEDTIKRDGTKWLKNPSHGCDPDLRDHRYTTYLHNAVFMNATGRTLAGCLGIVFGKPATISATGEMEVLIDDADGQGKPLSQMIRDAMSENLQTSRGGILVDYTATGLQTATTSGRVIFRLFDESQIINWRVVNQQLVLLVLKYKEAIDDPEGFDYQEKDVWDEYRMRDGACWYRRHELAPAGSLSGIGTTTASNWVPITGPAGAPLSEIPFAWFGGTNNDAEPDNPILGDIASLNIKHYNREADVAEAAHIAAIPTMFMMGLNQAWVDKNLKKGVYLGTTEGVPLPTGADAKLLQAEERNMLITLLERLEKQMAMLGAKLVERGQAAKTAAQANDEAQTDNSILSLAATNIERAFMKAFEYAADFVSGSGEVVLSKKYEVATYDSAVIQTLMGAVQSGQFMLEDFVRHLQREGLVDAEIDPEKYADELRNAAPLNSMKQPIDQDGNPVPIGKKGAAPKDDTKIGSDDKKSDD